MPSSLAAACCRAALRPFYRLYYPRFQLQRRLPPVPDTGRALRDNYGCEFVAYPAGSCWIAGQLYYFGAFDPWIIDSMRALSRPGDVVCDIGACWGDTALPLARHVGPGDHVHCFEPEPGNVARLTRNVAHSRLGNVSIHPLALSDADGTLSFEVDEAQSGMSGVSATQGSGVEVAAMRFDSWRSAHGIGRVAVCKIDTEGHEWSVVEGMRESVADRAVTAFIIESTSPGSREALRFLRSAGYELYRIERRRFSTVFAAENGPKRGRQTIDMVALDPRADIPPAFLRLAGR